MTENIKTKDEPQKEEKKMRQIIIETDGNDIIHLVKAEVSGKIELTAILQRVISALSTQTVKPEKR